jgi:hypothetical protein
MSKPCPPGRASPQGHTQGGTRGKRPLSPLQSSANLGAQVALNTALVSLARGLGNDFQTGHFPLEHLLQAGRERRPPVCARHGDQALEVPTVHSSCGAQDTSTDLRWPSQRPSSVFAQIHATFSFRKVSFPRDTAYSFFNFQPGLKLLLKHLLVCYEHSCHWKFVLPGLSSQSHLSPQLS